MEGKGVMVWPDQARYEGEFKNGKMEGKGTKVFASGNKYIGQWKNDLQHGTGVFFSVKEQTKRQGEWQNGKRYSWIASPQSTHVSARSGPFLVPLDNSKMSSRQGSPNGARKTAYA